MTKLLKLILPLAVMLSAFSGCNNIVKDNSQSSQETTSQTASETVSETTASQTEAKKELKGDMTIKKAYKLPDLGFKIGYEFPYLVGSKIISGVRTGEALINYTFNDEFGEYNIGFYPIDIVVTDAITGEQNIIYSDVMQDSYFIIPGNDEKTAYLLYFEKANMVDTSEVKSIEDVTKHRRVIKIDLINMTYKELDFSKYEGTRILINPLGENKLIITQFKEFPVTDKDFEGRNVEFSYEDSTVESRTIDIMDLDSGEVKNFYYDKMDEFKIIPGEKKIDSIRTCYYDSMTIFYTEELTAENTYKLEIQVYDENMNLIYEDVVDSIDNYKDGDFIDISSGACNGDIYVSWNKCKSDGTDYYADRIYYKKGNTYEKSQPKIRTKANGGYYQYTTKTHPEFNYGIDQLTDDTNTSTQLKLYNYCTEEELFLDIDVEGFKTPKLITHSWIENHDGSGNMLIVGNGSDRENNLEFWFVPKEEIKRALYGE